MSYYIDIINTTSPLTQVVVENASASGIVLKWNGGDTKDGMSIVTSEFNFDMLSTTADDAAFISFFTGDEHKYKVLVKNSVDDVVVWTGYVLPDLYSEPYKNGCFFVSFTASDGLGRLKGKYLPDEYYSREKSLIDIYCQILKLTGIELDLYFLPAIENFVNKDWDTIFINTENFIDGKKKKDAYAILETLLEDTLCVCYQCDNRWNIEGINQRNVRNVTYKVYDVDGVFVENVTYNRLLKNITPLQTPTITIVPPYNEITVKHKKIAPSLPKTISKEVNDGWAITTGVQGEIHSSSWMANGGFYTKCKAPEYYCTFYNKGYILGNSGDTNYTQDDTQYISLREKLFIAAGQKLKFTFKFGIKKTWYNTENPSNMLLWKNPFKYEIVFNGNVIFSNFNNIVSDNENVIFDDNGIAEIAIEHIFMQEGLLDLRFYGPTGTINVNKIEGIIINNVSIDVISFQEEEIITDLISGDFTIDKEVELTFSDDKSGVSEGFRLAKLKEQTSFFNTITIPILYVFPGNSKLLVVQLEGANLIKENLYSTYIGGVLVTVLNVYYNYNNGEQMVVELEDDYVSGVLTVKKYAVDDVVASRNHWTQWTDSIYKIENSSYGQVVANIYRRIFNQAVEKIDLTSLDAVKFNDIILFRYVYEKDFYVLNTSWNLDENKSTLTLGRSHYKDANSTTPGDENIPPIVLAGTDIFIADGVTTASLLATAYDPDGYIFSQNWTKTVGGAGDVITTPSALSTTLTNLTEDYYTYQIQVTDNNGATATDTVNVIRLKDYTVEFNVISVTDDSSNATTPSIQSRYSLDVVSNVPIGFVFTLSGKMKSQVSVTGYANGYDAWTGFKIEKNGAFIDGSDIIGSTTNIPIILNYVAGDEIFIELTSNAVKGIVNPGDGASAAATFIIESLLITSGVGSVIGLPVQIANGVSVTSD
jgi:hypothetical protein